MLRVVIHIYISILFAEIEERFEIDRSIVDFVKTGRKSDWSGKLAAAGLKLEVEGGRNGNRCLPIRTEKTGLKGKEERSEKKYYFTPALDRLHARVVTRIRVGNIS